MSCSTTSCSCVGAPAVLTRGSWVVTALRSAARPALRFYYLCSCSYSYCSSHSYSSTSGQEVSLWPAAPRGLRHLAVPPVRGKVCRRHGHQPRVQDLPPDADHAGQPCVRPPAPGGVPGQVLPSAGAGPRAPPAGQVQPLWAVRPAAGLPATGPHQATGPVFWSCSSHPPSSLSTLLFGLVY